MFFCKYILILIVLYVMYKNKNIIMVLVRDGCWGIIDFIFFYDFEY